MDYVDTSEYDFQQPLFYLCRARIDYMLTNSRGFAPLLIILGLAVIGIVGFLFFKPTVTTPPGPKSSISPTPSPDYSEVTSNWKTYTNSQYDYAVKYPVESTLEEPTEDIYLNHVIFGERTKDNSLWFEITVREASLDEEVDYIEWQSSHSLVVRTNEKDLSVQGLPAKRLDYEPSKYDEPKPSSFIIINRGKYSYTLSSRPEDIDKIISTFRFFEKKLPMRKL